ncbi:hypothetical protein [Geodermatophilus saharensis]|uniref:hypothetical protein n=1 Tax=Geodermatophilus saharensis TaxID=1137994 RepID=UPI001C3DE770|nr:hypothetical protein [Geodermatophilus saharensis]
MIGNPFTSPAWFDRPATAGTGGARRGVVVIGRVVGQGEDELGLVGGVHRLAGLQALQLGGLLLPRQHPHRQPRHRHRPREQPPGERPLDG